MKRAVLIPRNKVQQTLERLTGIWSIVLLLCLSATCLPQDASRFEKEVLAAGCNDPLQLDIAADGRVFFVERKGAVKMWEPESRRTVTIGDFPAITSGDAGALGLTLARDFEKSGQLYTIRVPVQGAGAADVARHTLAGEKLTDERVVLTIPLRKGPEQYHCGAGLAWDAQGNLLIGVGDNMPPQDVPAIHSRTRVGIPAGPRGIRRSCVGRSCGSRQSRTGAIAFQQVICFASAADGRPEVFAFGVRNPFRVTCDLKTGLDHLGRGWLQCAHGTGPGPEGFDELNVTREPGFFGWPFVVGPNLPWRPFDPKTQKPAGDYLTRRRSSMTAGPTPG